MNGRRERLASGLVTLALAALPACAGSVTAEGEVPPGPTMRPADPKGTGGTAGGAAGSGGSGGGGTTGSPGALPRPTSPTCAARPGVVAGPAPLARLSNAEYRNTLRDLFPKVTLPLADLDLPAEVATLGFTNTAEAQSPSAEVVEAAQESAQIVAKAAVADLTKILPCRPAGAADEPACGRQFLASFGKQAFRRPLTEDEIAKYGRFFTDAHGKWGFATAIRLVVEAFLQAPHFLYRIELGAPARAGDAAAPLGPYELATRLSYFLTDSTPDAALLAAADAGKLGTPAGVEAEARRLLGDAKTRAAVASFHAQWLRFDMMDNLVKSKELYPKFTPATATAMKAAAQKYVERLFWDEGRTLEAFLTDDHAFVNDALAPVYNVAAPMGATLAWTKLDAAQRAGILTQAGLLAGFAHERSSAPVLRGIFVLDRLLCARPPAPPAEVDTALPELEPGTKLTTRQQLERSHSSAECAGCHKSIDGAGFGFENYDAVGAWRTTELGLPVDPRGELVGTDVDGPFTGAAELGKRLATSEQVRACVARQWLGYALAASRQQVDDCALEPIAKAFSGAKGDLRELLVAIAKSDAFRHRPTTTP
jgi:hypothetical protein